MMLHRFLTLSLLLTLARGAPVPGRLAGSANDLTRLADEQAMSLYDFFTHALPARVHSPGTHPFTPPPAFVNSPSIAHAPVLHGVPLYAINARTTARAAGVLHGEPVLHGVPVQTIRPSNLRLMTGTADTTDRIHQDIPRTLPNLLELEGGPGVRAPPNSPESDQKRYRIVYGYSDFLPPKEPDVQFIFPPHVPTRRPCSTIPAFDARQAASDP